MKKRMVLCVSILICFAIHVYGIDSGPLCLLALGPNKDIVDYNYDLYVEGSEVALRKLGKSWAEAIGNGIYTRYGKSFYDIINNDSIYRDKNGFPVATFFGRDAHFLLGGNYVVFRFLDEEESGMVFLPETCQELLETGHDIWSSGVEVSCLSYLIEGTKQYTTSGLTKTFIGVRRDGGMLFNTMGLPWSEGEEGPGIGVILSIQFEPGSELVNSYDAAEGTYDTISIMNGYVDFYRPHLFKRNNRVKKVLIKSTDDGEYFEQEYELLDVPEFQTIQLPRKAQSVDMIIREVYEGTLYDDTVITSILPLGNNFSNIFTFDELISSSVSWRDLENNE